MGLFDKAKSLAQPSFQDMADRQAPEIANRIVSQLSPLLEEAARSLDDDSKYLSYGATPLFRALPPMVQMIGRERLKWDPIMLDMRDHLLVRTASGANVQQNAVPLALAILRKHFKGEQSDLLTATDTVHVKRSST